MSNTDNHKKMFHILREAKKQKGLLLSVMFQAMEDNPGTIARAYEKVVGGRSVVMAGQRLPCSPWPAASKNSLYQCQDCNKFVFELGIAGACIKCDPKGFDVPY